MTSRLVRLPPACWGSLPCISGRDCRPFLSRDSCRDGKGLDERPDCLGPGRVAGWWLGWAPPWTREDTGIRTWVFIISGVSLGSPGPRWASLSLSATCRAGCASTCQFDSLGPAQVSTWARVPTITFEVFQMFPSVKGSAVEASMSFFSAVSLLPL